MYEHFLHVFLNVDSLGKWYFGMVAFFVLPSWNRLNMLQEGSLVVFSLLEAYVATEFALSEFSTCPGKLSHLVQRTERTNFITHSNDLLMELQEKGSVVFLGLSAFTTLVHVDAGKLH